MSPITCFGLSALLTCPPLLKTAVISAIFLLFSLLLYSYSSFVGSTCFPSAESTASAASADQPPGSSSPVHTGSWLLPYALVCCSPFVFLTIFFSFPCTAMPLCSAAFFFVCWLKPKHSPFFSPSLSCWRFVLPGLILESGIPLHDVTSSSAHGPTGSLRAAVRQQSTWN